MIAGLRLFAYCNWPSDEKRRNEFLAWKAAEAVAAVSKLLPPQPAAGEAPSDPRPFWAEQQLVWSIILNDHFAPLGGFQTLLNSGSLGGLYQEAERNGKAGNAAGWVLIYARLIANHFAGTSKKSSVGRAADLVERFTPHNRKDIWNAWSEFGSVAHLLAANIILQRVVPLQMPSISRLADGGVSVFEHLGLFLCHAIELQSFGLSYFPRAQKVPILDETVVWKVPAWLALPQSERAAVAGLPSEVQRAIEEYRAPTRRHDA